MRSKRTNLLGVLMCAALAAACGGGGGDTTGDIAPDGGGGGEGGGDGTPDAGGGGGGSDGTPDVPDAGGGDDVPDVPAAGGGGDDDGTVTAHITPAAGGTLTTGDGRLTLTFPPGAVAAATDVSVRPVASADAEPDAFPAGVTYDLQPDGLEFAVPVPVELRIDAAALAAAAAADDELEDGAILVPSLFLVSIRADGTADPLDAAALSVTETGATLSGALRHFSELVAKRGPVKMWSILTGPKVIRVGASSGGQSGVAMPETWRPCSGCAHITPPSFVLDHISYTSVPAGVLAVDRFSELAGATIAPDRAQSERFLAVCRARGDVNLIVSAHGRFNHTDEPRWPYGKNVQDLSVVFPLKCIGESPVVTEMTPKRGPVGTVVVLRGDGIAGTDPSATHVKFGGVAATVLSAMQGAVDEVVVHVPADAVTAEVTVEIGGFTMSAGVFTVTAPPPSPCRAGDCKLKAKTTGLTNLKAVGHGGGKFVAAGPGRHATSDDGDAEEWDEDADGEPSLTALACGGEGLWLGALDSMPGAASSEDGESWTTGTGPGYVTDLLFTGGRFIATTPDVIYTSPDGREWTPATHPEVSGTLNAVGGDAADGGRLVAVGQGLGQLGDQALVMTSDDGGLTWEERPSAAAATRKILRDVARGPGFFFAVGEAGTILTSPDGAEWQLAASPGNVFLGTTCATGDVALAGGQGALFASSDGASWQPVPLPEGSGTPTLVDCAVGASRIVLGAHNGTVFTAER